MEEVAEQAGFDLPPLVGESQLDMEGSWSKVQPLCSSSDCSTWDVPADSLQSQTPHHPSAISFFRVHTILHDILGFDTIITRYLRYFSFGKIYA